MEPAAEILRQAFPECETGDGVGECGGGAFRNPKFKIKNPNFKKGGSGSRCDPPVVAGGCAEAVRAVGQGKPGLPQCGGGIFRGVPGVGAVRAEEAGGVGDGAGDGGDLAALGAAGGGAESGLGGGGCAAPLPQQIRRGALGCETGRCLWEGNGDLRRAACGRGSAGALRAGR